MQYMPYRNNFKQFGRIAGFLERGKQPGVRGRPGLRGFLCQGRSGQRGVVDQETFGRTRSTNTIEPTRIVSPSSIRAEEISLPFTNVPFVEAMSRSTTARSP